MRKNYFANSLRVFGIFLLLTTGSAQALVTWTDGNTPDVVDDNLLLNDFTIFMGPNPAVSITANTVDIEVNLGFSIVALEGLAGGGSTLYLNANNGNTITFNMTGDLTFKGSVGGAVPDLLVAISGSGQVIFNMDGGTTLLLTRNGVGGVIQMYMVMDDPTFPTMRLQRTAVNPDSNVEVIVEDGCILSYLSTELQPNSSQQAEIVFDTTNATGVGRSILTIGDQSAIIVRGRLLTNPGPDFQLSDIDPTMRAGLLAKFSIQNNNASTSGSLLVQNFNNTIGDLVWDPWFNLSVRLGAPFTTFSGTQYGFIIGSFGELDVQSNAYLDYVGLTGTVCVDPAIPNVDPTDVSSKVKARSGSALFTDAEPNLYYTPPVINIEPTAGIYFRSGIDVAGNIRSLANAHPYTIDPENRTPGAGIPVFDIEGDLHFVGANTSAQELSMFQLLSLEVAPAGGSLFAEGTETIFPLRTFATESVSDPCTGATATTFLSYNNACFINNGRVNLFNLSWEHTDQNHYVIEKNDINSEPAYIGGETWLLANTSVPPICMPNPIWAFINSRFNIHTSVALTGLDLLVPNGYLFQGANCDANSSLFVFYQNGFAIDNGTGRQMNLGTYIGSTACDGCTVISKDAELEVTQTQLCSDAPPVMNCDPSEGFLHQLSLQVAPNTDKIVQGILSPAAIANQFSIQTIYLGNNSNISVGTLTNNFTGQTMEPNYNPQVTFPLTTCPELLICGNFFSFETRGGDARLPSTSSVSGQGGIFVDTNGTLSICSDPCRFLSNMGVMVTRSGNGIINLPENQVFFDARVGIANWLIDLSNPTQVVIVPAGSNISDYTLNWQSTIKDYETFQPYVVDCINTCSSQEVTSANVTNIPTIQGHVQQLQLAGTRLGDPAHIKIDGGIVEELVFLLGYGSAEAPVAVVVLENQGTVGLGTAHRNIDSTFAEFTLGANGVNLILNSTAAQVVINEDMIINNVCSILPGPAIAGQPATLTFSSNCCNTLRVTRNGVLDLTLFDDNQVIEFAGNLEVVFEPGARVLLNNGSALAAGPKLRWADQATCVFSPVLNTSNIFSGSTVQNTDPYRVRFTGIGQLEFADCSRGQLFRDAFVGIESLPECDILGASIALNIIDSAQFLIGDADCQIEGGALQIGNTVDGLSPVVSFNLFINGPDAKFEIGPQGFFGAGVGIVAKDPVGIDNWSVAPTANLAQVSFNLQNGTFRHSQIYAGSDARSSLFALSNSIHGSMEGTQGTVFNLNAAPLLDPTEPVSGTLLSNISLLGGGNFIVVYPTATAFPPVVESTAGDIDANYSVGLLASRPLIVTNTFTLEDAKTALLFMELQPTSVPEPTTNRGVAGQSYERNEIRLGWLDNLGLTGMSQIGREDWSFVRGQGTQNILQQAAVGLGAVGVILAETGVAPRAVISVLSIGS